MISRHWDGYELSGRELSSELSSAGVVDDVERLEDGTRRMRDGFGAFGVRFRA